MRKQRFKVVSYITHTDGSTTQSNVCITDTRDEAIQKIDAMTAQTIYDVSVDPETNVGEGFDVSTSYQKLTHGENVKLATRIVMNDGREYLYTYEAFFVDVDDDDIPESADTSVVPLPFVPSKKHKGKR